LNELAREFTYTFGGCTTVHGPSGSYLSQAGLQIQDRITLIYTDTPYSFENNFETVSTDADKLKGAAAPALEEEAVLVAVTKVYHAD
jgi:hypothetical protein